MQIYSPNNIFTSLLLENLNSAGEFNINFLPSSLVANRMKEETDSVFLIPVLDLIKHEDIFVSSKIGISFQGNLSNTYFYFNNKAELKNLVLKGDVSTTEVLLSKIVLKELYDLEVEVQVKSENENNILLCGNENFNNTNFAASLSLSETIDELISLPFTNFVFASYEKSKIEKLNSLAENLNNKIYEGSGMFFKNMKLKEDVSETLENEIPTVTFELFDEDKDAVNQLIRLPYYYGIFEEIIETKFV